MGLSICYNLSFHKTLIDSQAQQFVYQNAATYVTKNKLSIRESAKKRSIDRMTFTRYLTKAAQKGPTNASLGYGSHKRILSKEMKSDLAKHFLNLCNRFFGLWTDKARSLAWGYTIRNKLDIPENWKIDQKSGKKCLRSFMQRNNLTLQKVEATSYGRATAINKKM